MTVKELQELLDTLPDDAIVYREGDEYNGDYRGVSLVDYRLEAGFDRPRNSVLIR
jgi:hypothetical protein